MRSVHRIDRDTSGLLVFARTLASEKALVEQFAKHTIKRTYLTVVSGRPNPGELRSRLIRDRGDGRRGSTGSETDGKLAVTHVREVQPIGDSFSLVLCQLGTGRTHQIRVHLSYIGYPIVGDSLYSGRKKGKIGNEMFGRLLLHAYKIKFKDPKSGKPVEYISPIPEEFQTALAKI